MLNSRRCWPTNAFEMLSCDCLGTSWVCSVCLFDLHKISLLQVGAKSDHKRRRKNNAESGRLHANSATVSSVFLSTSSCLDA
jgi:hypothetical protein